MNAIIIVLTIIGVAVGILGIIMNCKYKKKIQRLFTSPFIFIYGIFITFALTFFPLGIVTIIGLNNLITFPFVYLTGVYSKLKYEDCFIFITYKSKLKSVFINNLLCLTVIVWLPFFITFDYIKTGEVFTLTKYHTT